MISHLPLYLLDLLRKVVKGALELVCVVLVVVLDCTAQLLEMVTNERLSK